MHALIHASYYRLNIRAIHDSAVDFSTIKQYEINFLNLLEKITQLIYRICENSCQIICIITIYLPVLDADMSIVGERSRSMNSPNVLKAMKSKHV